MLEIVLATAGLSLLALVITLALGIRFFGALSGNDGADDRAEGSDSDFALPRFTRF